MSMAQLVAAGAPELPEGWFYRITTTGFGYPTVQIRQPGRWFGSREVSYAIVRSEEHENGDVAVIAACVKAWERLKEDEDYARKVREALTLRGDHDPRGGR
ncbi:hypothetical protein ABZ445_16160 [Streptomyces chartreusis]|uniref:hypothetical protein n=1 Tax=Streptomyces chartreusis TaxID=1969 RepID=UPI0033E1EDA5